LRFYSRATGLRVQITSGGMRPDPKVPGLFQDVAGKVALFKGGFCDITDPDDVAALKQHMGYGYGKDFWADEDRPVNEQQADKLARIEAELEALKAATGKQVITVERTAPVPTDEGDSLDMGELRARAKELGIKTERTWKREDYERALLTNKEG
jgi:hypothetical protein